MKLKDELLKKVESRFGSIGVSAVNFACLFLMEKSSDMGECIDVIEDLSLLYNSDEYDDNKNNDF